VNSLQRKSTMAQSRMQLAIRHSGRGPTWAIAAVIMSLLTSLIAIDGAAAKEFPPFGDRGDAQATDRCKPGTFLIGLKVRSGDWVDQIEMICAPRPSHRGRGPYARSIPRRSRSAACRAAGALIIDSSSTPVARPV
jgi:hypothetical protein